VTIDANGRESKRHAGEDADQHRVQAAARNGVGDELFHRRDVVDRRLGVELLQDIAHVGHDRHGIAHRPT
jgi:hypothetical protein